MDNKGFTLIELLVTFTMIAVISGIGFASFSSYSRRQTVVQASYDVKQAIDEARFAALASVKEKSDTSSVCPTSDLLSYQFKICENTLDCQAGSDYEVVANCTTDGSTIISSTVISSKVLPPEVGFSDVTFETRCTTLTFSALASATAVEPCEEYVSGYSNQVKISVDEYGYAAFSNQ